jgi:hypothetical protein
MYIIYFSRPCVVDSLCSNQLIVLEDKAVYFELVQTIRYDVKSEYMEKDLDKQPLGSNFQKISYFMEA